MRAIILIVLATAVAGCATEPDRQARFAANDDSECKSYGGQPGTPAYLQCRAQLDAARTQAHETAAADPAFQGKQ
jgi:hypothetical protein